MPLTTVAAVESTGALTPQLFNFPDQPTLDTFVLDAIVFADSWMQGFMKSNYNLQQFAWQVVLQERGQRFLALETIVKTLQQEKVVGEHYEYIAEASDAYSRLANVDWGTAAIQALSLWVTTESSTHNFAAPVFLLSPAIPETDATNNGLDPLDSFYAGILDRARGGSTADIATVAR